MKLKQIFFTVAISAVTALAVMWGYGTYVKNSNTYAGQQAGVKLVVDLDVARQAKQVLLNVGEGLDAAIQGAQLGVDAPDLGIDGLNAGVLGGKAGFELFALLLQLEQAGTHYRCVGGCRG